MKIAFLTSRPAQVTAPVFKRLASVREDVDIEVAFWHATPEAMPVDHEMGFAPEWGFDLMEGYESRVLSGSTRRIGAFLMSRDADVTFVPGWSGRWPWLGLVLGLFTHRIGVISDVVSFEPRQGMRRRLRRVGLRIVLRAVRAAIATGSLAADELTAFGVPAARTYVIPYMVELAFVDACLATASAMRSRTRAELGLGEDDVCFVAAIKLVEREGVRELVDAFVGTDLKLVVVGDGPLRGRVESAGIPCVGYQSYRDLFRYLVAGDVFVHPPLHESWGISVVEAMLARRPVISSDGVGAGLELVDETIGRIYPRRDARALRSAADELASFPAERRSAMGDRGRERAIDLNESAWRPEFERLVADLRASAR